MAKTTTFRQVHVHLTYRFLLDMLELLIKILPKLKKCGIFSSALIHRSTGSAD
jgi:hypothetical protein